MATSGSQVATITVQASDHPYGLFTFSSAFRPLVVVEDGGQVEVMVTREFGDLGRVTVSYATVESGHNSLQGLVDVTQLEQNRCTNNMHRMHVILQNRLWMLATCYGKSACKLYKFPVNTVHMNTGCERSLSYETSCIPTASRGG